MQLTYLLGHNMYHRTLTTDLPMVSYHMIIDLEQLKQ